MEFIKGQKVEVTSSESGFEDSWFVATITRRLKNKKFLVEYQSLVDETNIPLRETVDFSQLRPLPPKETATNTGKFQLNEEVDASLNDGWWKGVICKILVMGSRYSVFFRPTNEEKEFKHSDLRTHLDWLDGKWVTPSQNQVTLAPVEVRFDDEASRGAWFPAIILENISKSSVLVAYKRLRFGEKVEQLREVVDSLHVRPPPPQSSDDKIFDILEKVDAFYDFGWWSGVITKVLAHDKYIVFFKHQNKQKEFNGSDLRLHMDWINEKWLLGSREIVVIGQNEASARLPNPTGNPSPQTPSGVSDVAQESKQHGLEGVDSQKLKVFKKKRGLQVGSGKIGQSEASGHSPNPTDNSALKTDMAMQQTSNGVSGIAHETELQGLGGMDDQTENALKRKRGRPVGSGKKRKTGSTKSLNRTVHPKSLKNETAITEMTDGQTECTPSSTHVADEHQPHSAFLQESQSHMVEDIGGPETESSIKEMTDVQTEHTQPSSHVVDKEDEPFSMFFKKSESHTAKDIGEVVDKQVVDVLNEASGDGSLPFVKTRHLWRAFECMQVFQLIPQQPHFRPLEKYDEEVREGYAVGHMVNFASLFEKAGKAKFEDPRSMFENKLKAINDLEELGFQVDPIRLRLQELLRIKDSYSQLQHASKTAESKFVEEKLKFDEVKQGIHQLNLKIQALLVEKESKGNNVAQLERTADAIKDMIRRAQLEFDHVVGSPLVTAQGFCYQ